MKRSSLMTLSVLVHVGVGAALGAIQVTKALDPTPIEISEAKPKPKPPQESKPAPPPPPPKAPPKRRAPPAPPAPVAAAVNDASSDFAEGVNLGVSVATDPGGGIAIPAQRSLGFKPIEAPVKKLAAVPKPKLGSCSSKPTKPRPLSVPRPAYPERAPSADGRVRLELTVAPTGEVVSVRVLQSLGEETDRAAVAAARRAKFEPALACGKPTQGTFTVAMRFLAG